MRDETRMLLESMGRLFEDHCTKAVADGAETGTFPAALWQAVSETGVPLAALPESAGGADAEWSDLYAVLRVAGRFAAPIPLAETMLAAWVASSAGLEVSEQPMTVGPVRADDRLTLERDGNGWRLSGRASRLPWATNAGADRAARRWTGRRDGGGAGWHRRRGGGGGSQHGRRTARHAEFFRAAGGGRRGGARPRLASIARRCIGAARWRARC